MIAANTDAAHGGCSAGNGSDEIRFAAGTNGTPIVLGGTQLTVDTDPLTVTGNGPASTIVDGDDASNGIDPLLGPLTSSSFGFFFPTHFHPLLAGRPPPPEGKDDESNKKKLTEEQKQQKQQTNKGGLDDTRTEGDVIGVRCDEDPPWVLIANRDGEVRVLLLYDTRTRCRGIRVGDYLEASGEKVHEQLFEAHDATAKPSARRGR